MNSENQNFENIENTQNIQNTQNINIKSDNPFDFFQPNHHYSFHLNLGQSVFVYPRKDLSSGKQESKTYRAFITDDGRTVIDENGYVFSCNLHWINHITFHHNYPDFHDEIFEIDF